MKVLKYLVCGLFVLASVSCKNAGIIRPHGWNYVRLEDTIECYERLSDNYYRIKGRNIYLLYTFVYWPDNRTFQDDFMAMLYFVDLEFLGKVLPFNAKVSKTIPVLWEDGSESILNVSEAEDYSLALQRSEALKFQKEFNRKKKCTLTVTTADGRKLTYDFDITRAGSINLEAML